MNKGVFCGLTMIGGATLGADAVSGLVILTVTWSVAWLLAFIRD
jgi:hypothetical protein